MLLFIINAVFRSSGDAAISMRVLWFANILNIILDPLLIFGIGPFPEMGIKGCGCGHQHRPGHGVLYQLYLLGKGKYRVKVRAKQVVIKVKDVIQLVKLSMGAIGQYIIATSSWIFLVWVVTSLGEEVVAGYTIAIRIIMFALLPAWGLANAAATLVGQNLGAQQPDRAERSAWVVGIANMVFLGLVSVIFIAIPDAFIGFFVNAGDEPVVMSSGITVPEGGQFRIPGLRPGPGDGELHQRGWRYGDPGMDQLRGLLAHGDPAGLPVYQDARPADQRGLLCHIDR
jgi:Na+-driven multidrug efflux pump